MKKLDKVVWGVIGVGNVCEVKSVPAMYKAENSTVKSVMRRNGEKARDFAQRHNIENWTTNAEELFNDPEINIIYISTPPDTHCELTKKASAAGKAVYVEKPMANTEKECAEMIEACAKTNVPLFVAYYRRALPGFNKLKNIIESGKIGEIRFVNIEMYRTPRPYDYNLEGNWRILPEISGGGYFHDMASHQLDYLDSLFGEIVNAKGIGSNQSGLYPADDIVTGVFQFQNGVIGTGMWCFTTDKSSEKETITIVGSKGHLVFNTFGSPMQIKITTSEGKELIESIHPEHIQQPLVQTIVDQMQGIGTCPSTGITGARTTKVMHEICTEIM